MESKFFEEWFREIFLRDVEKLKKSVLIVMDNARFRRKRILEKIIKEETGYLSIISSTIFTKFKSNKKYGLTSIRN
mgnify:CR=1 FL=1